MRHPFQSLPDGKLRTLFLPALTCYVILQVTFAVLDVPLWPNGIVSFELAGSASGARAILASWNSFARLDAAFGLGLDYLFMLAYSTLIGIGCIWAGRMLLQRGWPLFPLAAPLAWGLWLAALCDATENLALLAQLFWGAAENLAQIAAICAAVKFVLIGIGLVYSSYGGLAWLAGRREVRRRLQAHES